MPQVSRIPIHKEIEKRVFEIFIDSVRDVKTRRDVHIFITDLLSHTEKTMLAKRLSIAFLLYKGLTYEEISHTLKVSTGTINKVSIAMQTGSRGYQRVIEKIVSREKREDFWHKIDDLIAEIIPPHGNWSEARRKRWQEKFDRQKPF